MSDLARQVARGRVGASALMALLATLYWTAIAVLLALSLGSVLVLIGGACAFVLLVWALRDGGAGRPRLSTWLLATASALYTFSAMMIVGIAAYIEGHGCALEPERCTGSGPNLFALTALAAASVYFLCAWLIAFTGARSRRQGQGGAEGEARR